MTLFEKIKLVILWLSTPLALSFLIFFGLYDYLYEYFKANKLQALAIILVGLIIWRIL